MSKQEGLRERKRRRTHDTISATAISLFLERGFDGVSVVDIAAAAEVSKPTLFRYFPTKEDLVLHRIADHLGEAARLVRDRAAGVSPLAALHWHFCEGLSRREPVTGLNDNAEVLAYYRMVFETASLAARVTAYVSLDEAALAVALGETGGAAPPLTAELAAAQIISVQRVLARENWVRLSQGRSAAEAYPAAVANADHAFGLLRSGLATYYA